VLREPRTPVVGNIANHRSREAIDTRGEGVREGRESHLRDDTGCPSRYHQKKIDVPPFTSGQTTMR
jgi:hypothetical protein